jgi:hypothetical protein
MPYKESEQIVMGPTLRKTELYSTNHHRCTRVENPGGGAPLFAKIPEGAKISGKIAREGPLFWVLLHALLLLIFF